MKNNRTILNRVSNDKHSWTNRLFWFIFVGSRGGANRLRIISAIIEKPLNTNQLAKHLGLDYKLIQHHIRVLSKNNIITKVGEEYGSTYFISNLLKVNMDSFQEITEKLQTTTVKKSQHTRIGFTMIGKI